MRTAGESRGPFRIASHHGGEPRTGRCRSDAYRSPTRAVRTAADAPDGLEERCDALLLVLPPCAVFYAPTAGRLRGMPVPAYADSGGRVPHVAVPADAPDHPRRRGVRIHSVRLPAWDRAEVGGRPVTDPARTFVDLGRFLTLPDLVAVGDWALREGLTTPNNLARRAYEAFGSRGIRQVRRALPLLDERAESPQESRLRVLIVLAALPAPVPNYVIRDEFGGFLARGDLVYPELRIVIEYDGAHHNDPRRRRADATRRTLLREHGWYVVEIHADDLRYPDRAVAKVTAALRVAGARW